jgi:hypothetical protein
LRPGAFHAANLILHACATLLVFATLRRLIQEDAPAFCGALLFGIHPVQAEPVAWITGMKDMLAGTLSLAAIHQYIRFSCTERDAASRVGR